MEEGESKMKNAAKNAQEPDNEIRSDTTVGNLVVRHPQLRQRLETLGIDYCCGGKIPLGEAVEHAGRQWSTVLAALKQALESEQTSGDNTEWGNVPLSDLADHIVTKHHAFMKEQLPRLDGLLARVQKAHGARHGAMLGRLGSLYGALRAELEPHLIKEEQILFPAIKGIDAFVSGTGERPVVHCGSVANPIRQMEREHDSAGKALAEMRQTTGNFQLPADACQTFAALYDGLKAMEADLHEHIHLENNILFPKSVAREHDMIEKEA
jgi:regulator of cell morphogenesis and NO signaling